MAGLSQRQLAVRLGCSNGLVSLWESGDVAELRADYLFKLADLSGLSARWVLFGVGAMRPRAWQPEDGLAALLGMLTQEQREELLVLLGE